MQKPAKNEFAHTAFAACKFAQHLPKHQRKWTPMPKRPMLMYLAGVILAISNAIWENGLVDIQASTAYERAVQRATLPKIFFPVQCGTCKFCDTCCAGFGATSKPPTPDEVSCPYSWNDTSYQAMTLLPSLPIIQEANGGGGESVMGIARARGEIEEEELR